MSKANVAAIIIIILVVVGGGAALYKMDTGQADRTTKTVSAKTAAD